MTAGKWSVLRGEDKVWRVWDGDGDYRGTYHTWEGAIRDADRGARAVTGALPADPYVWLSGLDSDGRRYVRDVNDNEICYEPGELETLALHLLAYARKERR